MPNQRSMRLLASPHGSRCASPSRGTVAQHPQDARESTATRQPTAHVAVRERPRSVSPMRCSVEPALARTASTVHPGTSVASVASESSSSATAPFWATAVPSGASSKGNGSTIADLQQVTLPQPKTEDGYSESMAAFVTAQQLQLLREEMQMEHRNLVQAVRIMELLLRNEVCTCMEAVKKEATLIEKHLEKQLGSMRTELFATVRDLQLALQGSGADIQEKGPEAALTPASSGRPITAPPAAALTPLTGESHEKRLASLDGAIEHEVAASAEMDRRLQSEMADPSHRLLGMEDSRRRALVSDRLQLPEPEDEPRRMLSSGSWEKGSRENFYSGASENLQEVSDSKDFGFGRLQSLLRAQQQQQQREKLLGTTVAVPAPPPAVSLTTATGQAPSVGHLQEQEDLRRPDAVCEAVLHDALSDLLDRCIRSHASPLSS